MTDHRLRPEDDALYPGHGWIAEASGMRQVRLPILRLYEHGTPTYARYKAKKLGIWLQVRSPRRTLYQLGACLADLHRETRIAIPLSQERWANPDNLEELTESFKRYQEGVARLEVLFIAAFTLLRRLGDDIVDATRPLLFSHWGQSPTGLNNLRKKALEKKLERYEPICNLNVLEATLEKHTEWFDALCEEGYRDVLIHKPHHLQIGSQGTSSRERPQIQWRATAFLLRERSGEAVPGTVDLYPALLKCVEGACNFMKQIVLSVQGIESRYDQFDVLFLHGSEVDVVGCWPPLRPIPTTFPLLS